MKWLGMLPIESVRPNGWNVNKLIKEEYEKLKAEMAKNGPEKTEAITVRKAEDGALEIVNGEQRWMAARELGWKVIPAQLVEADRDEAKYLSLSYNAIRGTVDFVKLSKLLLEDPEMVEASIRVYGKKKTEKLMESARRLTKEAEDRLAEAVMEGANVTPEKISIVAHAPPHVQELAAEATKVKDNDETYIKAVIQKYACLEESGEDVEEVEKEEKLEAEREEKPEVERGERAEARPEEPSRISGKAAEVASYVRIDVPGEYLIRFNAEKREIDVRPVKIAEMEGGRTFDYFDHEYSLPKTYSIQLKCRCGRLWRGEFDASSGEYWLEETSKS